MRLSPLNLVLGGVFALLVILNVVLEPQRRVAADAGRLLEAFDPARVERVEVLGPGDQRVLLARGPEEGTWVLPERRDFAAYGPAVEELLGRLRHLVRADRVGSEPESYGVHGVGDGAVRISCLDADGTRLAAVVQGVPPGLAAGSNVRVVGEDGVYRAPAFAPVVTAVAGWIDTRLVDLDPAAVMALTVSHDAGRMLVDLERSEDGWRPRGASPGSVSGVAVERFLGVAATLVFRDLSSEQPGPDNGFGSPPATLLEFELADGSTRSVVIGHGDSEGAYLATNPDWPQPWCVLLGGDTAELLFATLEGLRPRD